MDGNELNRGTDDDNNTGNTDVAEHHMSSLSTVVKDLASGSHNVKIQWRVSVEGVSLSSYGAAWSSSRVLSVVVFY